MKKEKKAMDPLVLSRLEFVKMHGLGNDYIVIDNRDDQIPAAYQGPLAADLCRDRFSVGADGMIFVCESTTPDYDIRFRIYNNDGSEAPMCGNGIRCFAKYVYEREILQQREMRVETMRRLIIPKIILENGDVTGIRVDMGLPETAPDKIPVTGDKPFVERPVHVEDREFAVTTVSVGNPHAVIFMEEVPPRAFVERYGGALESHTAAFPEKINVEFVQILSEREARFRVYERAVGITNACGTGASAVAYAGVMLGKFRRDAPLLIHLDGGDLEITVTSPHDRIFMEGPATEVYAGVMEDVRIVPVATPEP